jgi:hypothetical protein
MSMGEFLQWYGKLDKETLTLLRRFMAKAFSQENANEYIKRVLRAELNNVEIESEEIDNG